MLQFCSIGRNFKLSFLAIAQRFQMLNTDLISLSGQLYVGTVHEENDLKKLRNWFGDKTEQLKTLQLGEFTRYSDGKIELMQVDKFNDTVEIVNIKPMRSPQPMMPQPKIDYTPLLRITVIGFIGAFIILTGML
jgi:hypothetical protein